MDKELKAKIENKKNNKNCGGGYTIGFISYKDYRNITGVKTKRPSDEEYELYKIWCYIRGFNAESRISIENGWCT